MAVATRPGQFVLAPELHLFALCVQQKSHSKEIRIFKLLKLRKSDFLRMLDNESLKLLARGSRIKTLRRGQVLSCRYTAKSNTRKHVP